MRDSGRDDEGDINPFHIQNLLRKQVNDMAWMTNIHSHSEFYNDKINSVMYPHLTLFNSMLQSVNLHEICKM